MQTAIDGLTSTLASLFDGTAVLAVDRVAARELDVLVSAGYALSQLIAGARTVVARLWQDVGTSATYLSSSVGGIVLAPAVGSTVVVDGDLEVVGSIFGDIPGLPPPGPTLRHFVSYSETRHTVGSWIQIRYQAVVTPASADAVVVLTQTPVYLTSAAWEPLPLHPFHQYSGGAMSVNFYSAYTPAPGPTTIAYIEFAVIG